MKTLFWLVGTVAFGLVLIVTLVGWAYLQLPDVTEITKCPRAAVSGRKLCAGAGSYVRLSQVSENLKQAVLLSEDAAFYTHEGFDWFELRNSFLQNLEEGRYVRGGSTITQQLAKNVFLTADKALSRKIKEAFLARKLEQLLSKNQILEYYLNVIEWGPGIYGIKQASFHYFKKPPSQLTPAEASYLAFLLPNPKVYSRSKFPDGLSRYANERVRKILGRMRKYGRISEEAYQQARVQLGDQVEALSDESFDGDLDPDFLSDQISDDLAPGDAEAEPENTARDPEEAPESTEEIPQPQQVPGPDQNETPEGEELIDIHQES